MKLSKKIAHALFSEYDLYRIYQRLPIPDSLPLPPGFTLRECSDPSELTSSAPEIAALDVSSVVESKCFVIWEESRAVAACIYWWGNHYAAIRKLWPLQPGQAKLVQVNTDPLYRNRGLASALISQSSLRMAELGFTSLYSRIWHNNHSSIRAFEKAGWKRVAFVIRIVSPLFGERKFTYRY